MFGLTITSERLLVVIIILYGVKLYRNSKQKKEQAAIDAGWNQMDGIYVKRRHALIDLTAHMEQSTVHYNETAEFDHNVRSTRDSLVKVDEAIANLKRCQEQGKDMKVDLKELREQVRWAKEAQELWLPAIEERRVRWSTEKNHPFAGTAVDL